MAPHVCTLLFKPRREDWTQLAAQLASSRWCAVTARLPRACSSALACPAAHRTLSRVPYVFTPSGYVQHAC